MISNLKESEQHQHSYGGGWIANTATVASTVYIDKHALVYGQADLADDVVVLDLAQVSGHVKLSGDVRVTGNAWLDGNFRASTGHFYKNVRVQEKQTRIR
jgi:carbonic anhydrase/acetyltransferase-like protein (isoleucine patch superfamily)